MMSPTLRAFQSAALAKCSGAFTDCAKAALIVSPPGTGKTRMAVEACAIHRDRGGIPMFIAPRRELVQQAERALRARGLTPEVDCYVRTIQALTQQAAVVPPATMIVLDEARHYLSPSWSAIRAKLPKAWVVGLDGTPERPDGVGLGGLFDVLIEAISINDAIAAGYLVQTEVIAPPRFLGPGELARDPVEAVIEFTRADESTMVFLPTVAAAQACAADLRAHGRTAEAVWGDMPAADRAACLERYAAGTTQILTNANLLTEGVDVPRTRCVVLARGFSTPGPYLQAIARAARPYAGKTSALVIDLRGVSHLHGAPEAPRSWSLEGRACRRPGDTIDTKFCPVCGAIVTTDSCEECGHAGEMRKRAPKILGLPMQRFAVLRREPDGERVKRLSRWFATARARGWHHGQAMHRFKAAYGSWPTGDIIRRAKELVA